MGGSCTTSGGTTSVQADLIDMRRTADTLDGSGDEATSLCLSVGRTAANLPLKSALLSPGSAADVAHRVFDLTVGSSGLGALALQMETVARGVRIGADTYQLADEAERRALAAIAVATAPLHLVAASAVAALEATADTAQAGHTNVRDLEYLKSWGRSWAEEMGEIETKDPRLTAAAVNTLRIIFRRIAPGAVTFQQQVALLLLAGRVIGRFDDDERLTVRPDWGDTPPMPSRGAHDLGDLIDQERIVESPAHNTDEHTTVRVHHVVHPDGRAAWVVDIPGTNNWQTDGPHNPLDGSGNLIAMAGAPAMIYPAIRSAMRRAMHQAGVKPGTEPVMLVGHSQGGIIATRMTQNTEFRKEFNVQEVVTVASPVTRMKIPDGVHATEIEHTGDIVPGLDADHTPQQANTVQFSCDPPTVTGDPLAQHHASVYARTAHEHLGRDAADLDLQRFYARTDAYFDGSDTTYDFTVRRP